MSPEEVRNMRGELSREEFAGEIGVTPLTVYRWELPTDRDESRRPQKRMQKRLRSWMKEHPSQPVIAPTHIATPAPIPATPLDLGVGPALTQTEQIVILPIYERILNAQWQSAEDALMQAMASGLMANAPARVLVQTASALLKLLWRGDARGAYTALAPILTQLDTERLPPEVEVRAHTAAALVFSWAEGLVFNAGRVSTHVAQAERVAAADDHEYRALLRVAEMWAAYNLGDATLHERLRTRSREDFKLATTTVARWMAWEVGTLGAIMAGCVVEGRKFLTELVQGALDDGFPLVAVRGSGALAYVDLYAGVHVDEVDAIIEHAWEVAKEHRIEPGYHTTMLHVAQADSHLRQAQFEASSESCEHALEEARRVQWPPVELVAVYARLLYLTAQTDVFSELDEMFADFPAKHRVQSVRVARTSVAAITAFSKLDMVTAEDEYRRAGDLARECGTLPELETYLYALSYYAAVLGGEMFQADTALRRAERCVERLPFVWVQGVLRLYKAVHASLRSRPEDVEQHTSAAESVFQRAGDEVQQALAKRLQAAVALVAGDPNADELLRVSGEHMESLGILMPPPYQEQSLRSLKTQKAPKHARCTAGSGNLIVPVDRLSVRGLGAAQILEELFTLVLEIPTRDDPEATTIVEEVSGGIHHVLHQKGDSEVDFEQEFGDGSGRRFRVGVSDGREDQNLRSIVDVLSSVASLALEVAALRALTNPASAAVSDRVPELPGVIAASDSTQELMREISRLGQSRANVLVLGESGSGKEVVAHAVHRLSTRSDRAFVTFNCSAVPRDLFEGQLFGYRKGAFTGATSSHPGVIRAADGGTLFLDEIGDLPLDVQPKLLRFLENGEVFPLGDTKPTHVDVRVIAATHRNLRDMVRESTFREDLFYRLAVVTLEVLPLRERREDILALARNFIERFAPEDTQLPKLSPDSAAKLLAHPWPGNVRELRNVIERSLAFSPLPEVLLPENLRF